MPLSAPPRKKLQTLLQAIRPNPSQLQQLTPLKEAKEDVTVALPPIAPTLPAGEPMPAKGTWGGIFYSAHESYVLERALLGLVQTNRKTFIRLPANLSAYSRSTGSRNATKTTPNKRLSRLLPLHLFNQIHSAHVLVAKQPQDLVVPQENPLGLFSVDGFITSLARLAFVIRTADCIPLIFSAKTNNVWGALHVSWRSLQAGILERTLLTLLPQYFSLPSTALVVYLGPSIKQCCYPVREDVIELLECYRTRYNIEWEAIYQTVPRSSPHERRYSAAKRINYTPATTAPVQIHLDLPQLCVLLLRAFGVKKEQIVISPRCTSCHGQYFSYRAHQTTLRNWNIVFKT